MLHSKDHHFRSVKWIVCHSCSKHVTHKSNWPSFHYSQYIIGSVLTKHPVFINLNVQWHKEVSVNINRCKIFWLLNKSCATCMMVIWTQSMDLTIYLWRRSGQETGDTTLSHRREFSHTLKKGSKACAKTIHLARPSLLCPK